MSICGVCGERLAAGMGHSCFRAARAVQPIGYDRAAEIVERVRDLRAWARSRIEHGRAAIAAQPENATATLGIAGEVRALEAVLRILDGEDGAV